MRVVFGTLLAGLVLVATVRAGEDAAKKELKKLNGTWIAIALEKDGEKLGENQVKELKLALTLKDGDYTVKIDGKVTDTGTAKVDPTKKPRPSISFRPKVKTKARPSRASMRWTATPFASVSTREARAGQRRLPPRRTQAKS